MDGGSDFLPLFLCSGFILTAGATIGILGFCSTYFYHSWSTLFCTWWLPDNSQEKDPEAATNVLHTLQPKKYSWYGNTFYDVKD